MGDMGNDPARESATCGHPAIGVGTDNTNKAEAPSAAVPLGDAYATRHDPFMYFHSIIDSPSCNTHVVNLNKLPADLAHEWTTPNLVFITPNLCDDGHDGSGTGAAGTTCANGQPGGLTSADAFLQKWVPQIMASPAYKKDGLLVITFDESNYVETVTVNASTGQTTVDITFPGDTCCNQQPGPNLAGVRPGTFDPGQYAAWWRTSWSMATAATRWVRCCSRPSSSQAAPLTLAITTTRCCEAWRTSSRCARISATPPMIRLRTTSWTLSVTTATFFKTRLLSVFLS